MGSSSSSRSVGMDKAVRFGNLWNRVEYAVRPPSFLSRRRPILTMLHCGHTFSPKHLLQAPDAQLHFLLALSALSPTTHDVPLSLIHI